MTEIEIPEPQVMAVKHLVSCLPLDHPDASAFTVSVEWRGERWAVMHNGAYLDAEGRKSWGARWEDDREPVTPEEFASYNRAHDAWLDAHRFDEETALRIAREYAPRIRIGRRGYGVADALRDLSAS